MQYIVMLVVVYALQLLLRLRWQMTLILFLFGIFITVCYQKRYRKQVQKETLFAETCAYIDLMLFSFSRSEKIEQALNDTRDAIEDGNLKELLKDACNHIEFTFDEDEVARHALELIERRYPCKRVAGLHRFMLKAELFGGETKSSVRLMLEDRSRWEKRIRAVINERKKGFREVVMSVIASILICGCIMHLPVMNINMSDNWITQVLSLVLIVLDSLLIWGAQNYLNADWINIDTIQAEEDALKKYREYQQYDSRKSAKVSYIWTIPVFIAGCICIYFRFYWWALFFFALSVVVVNQHTIGHRLLRKNLEKQIKSAFPGWLVDLMLFLQTENVQVAIHKSRELAPAILLDDLDRMEDELNTNPETAEPYHHFLQIFEIPQIHFAMSMLYSLAEGKMRIDSEKLSELIDSNYRMLDEAERVRLADRGSGLYLLFLMPVLTASLKLVVDMALFMAAFVGTGFI